MYHEFLHNLVLIEVIFIVADTILIALLFSLPVRKSFTLSFIANFVSALVGILIAGRPAN